MSVLLQTTVSYWSQLPEGYLLRTVSKHHSQYFMLLSFTLSHHEFSLRELKLFFLIRFHRLSRFKLCKFEFCLTLPVEQSMKYYRNISSQWLNLTNYSNKRPGSSLTKTWQNWQSFKIYREILIFNIMRIITCFNKMKKFEQVNGNWKNRNNKDSKKLICKNLNYIVISYHHVTFVLCTISIVLFSHFFLQVHFSDTPWWRRFFLTFSEKQLKLQ